MRGFLRERSCTSSLSGNVVFGKKKNHAQARAHRNESSHYEKSPALKTRFEMKIISEEKRKENRQKQRSPTAASMVITHSDMTYL